VARPFRDRQDAGQQLAPLVAAAVDADAEHVVVVGLPRGGVPVAAAVAARLAAPLDVILVRKLGAPAQPELAMGALGQGGVRVLDEHVVRQVGATGEQVAAVERAERIELERRSVRYRGGRGPLDLRGRAVVVVDDGIATGSTARAACAVARAAGCDQLVLAVPVAPSDWRSTMAGVADRLVAVVEPDHLGAVGQAYEDFAATSDDEVVALLRG
jgi:predicted phosphoribosyltransferase